jgi:deazaflavin-dependent oxidoreductase (nitroreductase family)
MAPNATVRDLVFKTTVPLHRWLVRVTGGRVGGRVLGMPAIELTTTGRKSGQPRSVMLTVTRQEGDTLVLVASKGGDDRNPDWYKNLAANPDVIVRIAGGSPRPMRARVADADERARLWPLITAEHRNYAGYQEKTAREIPVVLVEPAS